MMERLLTLARVKVSKVVVPKVELSDGKVPIRDRVDGSGKSLIESISLKYFDDLE